MIDETSKDDKIFEEAFDLIIRQHSDRENPVTRALIRSWRSRSPAHEAAWSEAMHIHSMSGEVVRVRQAVTMPKPNLSRRRFVLGGGVALATLGVGLLAGPELLLRIKADNKTTTAELRHFSLEDDTLVSLGPDSAITSTFTSTRRRVELLEGMAYFNVAADETRPFQAVADKFEVSSFSGGFDLSIDAGIINIAVERGDAGVLIGGSTRQDLTLVTGDWLSIDGETLNVERGRRTPEQIAAWRSGMLVVEQETISSVVARIARWKRGKVLIADRSLGAQKISGVYNLHNPVSALAAAVQPRGGTVRELTPWLTVIT